MSVALDSSLEEARPYVERAKPEHPSLIDTEHVVADLYGMINVPTGVSWVVRIIRLPASKTVVCGVGTVGR